MKHSFIYKTISHIYGYFIKIPNLHQQTFFFFTLSMEEEFAVYDAPSKKVFKPKKASKAKPKKVVEIGGDGEDGNTNLSSPPATQSKTARPCQLFKWSFTWNNYPKGALEMLETYFKQIKSPCGAIQEETGDCGTPHLQGAIELEKRKRWTEFHLPKEIHWSKTENEWAAINYCRKTDTRTGRLVTWGLPELPKPLKLITELRPWQKWVETIALSEPDGRTIHWLYDTKGGLGKSKFTKYMAATHNTLVIQGGGIKDIINLIFKTNMDKVNALMIDVPRINNNKVSYGSIECILNGMITNTKFETGVKMFNPPHVFVFCNFKPNTEALSEDRWKIYNLENFHPITGVYTEPPSKEEYRQSHTVTPTNDFSAFNEHLKQFRESKQY